MAFVTIKIQDISGEQMIKLPVSFRIDDDKVYIKKSGNAIYLIPYHNPWQSMIESVEEFSDDYLDERQQSHSELRESFDP